MTKSVRGTELPTRRESRLTGAHGNGSPRVAVVGAGISGLICARTLADHGVTVTVFEKSRGVAGRMATRRTEDGLAFDHGAQYFTVSDESFGRHVRSWQEDGLVETWNGMIRVLREGRIDPCQTQMRRFVGTPGMTAVCKHLATEIDVHLRCEIASLQPVGNSWRLTDRTGKSLDTFDIVVVSAPSPQSARLLEPVPELAGLAGQVIMEPCWAVMAAFDTPLPAAFDGAFVQDSALSWVARNSSKPARPSSRDCWVLHGSASWSREYIDETVEEVKVRLLEEFWRMAGLPPIPPTWIAAHLWRYALPLEPLQHRCLFDPASGLGACGEWCPGPRVEGAFLSGAAAARCVLRAAGLVS